MPASDALLTDAIDPSAPSHSAVHARLEGLMELAFALSGAVDPADVAELVVEHGKRHAGADTATLYALDQTGEALELLAQRGVAAEVLKRVLRISRSEGDPRVLELALSGRSLWVETEQAYFEIYPELARTPASGARAKAFWSVPLLAEGRTIGLLGMGFYGEQHFSKEDRRFAETFAKLCAQALLRALRRRRELVAENRRAFLARAMETLASSLDFNTTLKRVAELAVPALADWCTIDIMDPGSGGRRQIAVAHVDPAKVAYAKEIGQRYPPNLAAPSGSPQVMRSGKSELYSHLTIEMVERAAQDEEHLQILRELKLDSVMIVALRSETGKSLGAITFIYADSGRHYSTDDLSFAEDFARRAALAIENAQAVAEVEAARAREQAMREQAELASTAKDHFLATVSHELRTPLNVILGWAVVLRERGLPPETERALGIIERNARAQARLIEDVLDVSRIISGKLALNLGAVNVADAVRTAALGMRPAVDAKGISLTVHEPSDERALTITADADRLQQILWNLLTNAVKFTPKGGSIVIFAERQGSEVQIHVRDDGEGIPERALRYVFEPFRQADSSTTRRHGGLGLGLSLVKQIVAAHGGTVEASSLGEGRGATFIVHLPARAATDAVARATPPGSRVMHVARTAVGRLDGVSVLVVDDELDARDLVGEAFKAAGAIVHLAGSASEALALIANERPAVLVSDIGMPYEDGYALMRRLRSLPAERGGQTPAVALTAYARASDAEHAFDAGYQRHVAKPVDPLELVELVADLVTRRR